MGTRKEATAAVRVGETKATHWGSPVTCGPESRLKGKSELPGVSPRKGTGSGYVKASVRENEPGTLQFCGPLCSVPGLDDKRGKAT